jgi:hypothetical protein
MENLLDLTGSDGNTTPIQAHSGVSRHHRLRRVDSSWNSCNSNRSSDGGYPQSSDGLKVLVMQDTPLRSHRIVRKPIPRAGSMHVCPQWPSRDPRDVSFKARNDSTFIIAYTDTAQGLLNEAISCRSSVVSFDDARSGPSGRETLRWFSVPTVHNRPETAESPLPADSFSGADEWKAWAVDLTAAIEACSTSWTTSSEEHATSLPGIYQPTPVYKDHSKPMTTANLPSFGYAFDDSQLNDSSLPESLDSGSIGSTKASSTLQYPYKADQHEEPDPVGWNTRPLAVTQPPSQASAWSIPDVSPSASLIHFGSNKVSAPSQAYTRVSSY